MTLFRSGAVANGPDATQWAGAAILLLATALWGTTFALGKDALDHVSPAPMLTARFVVAAIIFLPFLRLDPRLWIAGLELGILEWGGYALQTIGLQYTTPGRSAFLTAMSVIFVPLFAAATGRRIDRVIWGTAIAGFIGAGLLSYDGSPPNLGDAWTVLCAACWGIYILRLEHHSPNFTPRALTAVQLVIVAAACAVWMGIERPTTDFSSFPWLTILYLAIAATALTTWLQTLGQRRVSAPRSAVIFTVEPVFATAFVFLWHGELPGSRGWIGSGLIVAAALVCALRKPSARIDPLRADQM